MKNICRKIALWLLMLSLCAGSAVAESIETAETVHTEMVYGQSELGRDLICHRVGAADAEKSILIVFGVHGFEDEFDHDGEVLELIAEDVVAHYTENTEKLQNFCLYIIPSANPDGLLEGKTKDGFGRCNANGLDINRDFPIGWTRKTVARSKTGKEPFATAEARAIRDLVEKVQPTYGIDVHGWIKASYGTGEMAKIFAKPFDFVVKKPKAGGMLCSYLDSVTQEGIMIELPPKPNKESYVTDNSEKLIAGVDAWIAHCNEGK